MATPQKELTMSRPYANVFFGMPVSEDDRMKDFDDWDEEQLVEKELEALGVEIVKTGSEDAESVAFAISELSQSEDWDSVFAPLKPSIRGYAIEGEALAILHDKIKSACKLYEVEYNREAVNWYMSAYLS